MVAFFELIVILICFVIYKAYTNHNDGKYIELRDALDEKRDKIMASASDIEEFIKAQLDEERWCEIIKEVEPYFIDLYGEHWREYFQWENIFHKTSTTYFINGYHAVANLYFSKRGKIICSEYFVRKKDIDNATKLFKLIESNMMKVDCTLRMIYCPSMFFDAVRNKYVEQENSNGKLIWNFHVYQFKNSTENLNSRYLW